MSSSPRRVRYWTVLRLSPACPLCSHVCSTGSGLKQHLRRTHAALGARARSLALEEARRGIGWPRPATAPAGLFERSK